MWERIPNLLKEPRPKIGLSREQSGRKQSSKSSQEPGGGPTNWRPPPMSAYLPALGKFTCTTKFLSFRVNFF